MHDVGRLVLGSAIILVLIFGVLRPTLRNLTTPRLLPVGEPARGPGLPVRRAEDERDDEREPDQREAADLRVHRGGSFARFEIRRRPARRTKFATTLDPP